MIKPKYIIVTLLGIILILSLVIIFKKPDSVVEEFDTSELEQKLEYEMERAQFWQKEASHWHQVADSALYVNDSLKQIEPIIITHYEKVYQAIPDGTNVQLDSIIRSNW